MDIHMGERTHHHDQLMTLHNFRTIKATASKPVNPIPLLDELEDDFDICIGLKFEQSFSLPGAKR